MGKRARILAALGLLLAFAQAPQALAGHPVGNDVSGPFTDYRAAPQAPAQAGSGGERGGWRTLPPSPLARTEVSGARVGRSMYVLGGYGSGALPSAAVERYRVRKRTWEQVRPLPRPLNHAGAEAWRGDLYVVGGYTGTPFSLGIGTFGIADATTAFLRYDPETDRWRRMPPAPTARAASATAVIGHRLYVAGGADAFRPLGTFEVFDFRRGVWLRKPDLPLATEHVAGAAVGGCFYVIGGRPIYGKPNHDAVQRWCPGRGRWQRVADLRTARAGFAAVRVCGRIVAFGGENPRAGPPGTIPQVEAYKPRRDRWRPLPPMGVPRHGLAGAAFGRRLFAVEGGTVSALGVSNTVERLRLPCGRQRP